MDTPRRGGTGGDADRSPGGEPGVIKGDLMIGQDKRFRSRTRHKPSVATICELTTRNTNCEIDLRRWGQLAGRRVLIETSRIWTIRLHLGEFVPVYRPDLRLISR